MHAMTVLVVTTVKLAYGLGLPIFPEDGTIRMQGADARKSSNGITLTFVAVYLWIVWIRIVEKKTVQSADGRFQMTRAPPVFTLVAVVNTQRTRYLQRQQNTQHSFMITNVVD